MAFQPLVCTVIVNWNRWEDTCACVASVLSMGYANLRIVVVDNGSVIGESVKIQKQCPQVEVIRSSINLGFAGGVNLALAQVLSSGADYIFTLNNDMRVDSQCLSELVAQAEQDPQAGIVGAKIYYLDRPEQIWFAGVNRNRWTLSLMTAGKVRRKELASKQPHEVNYLCAGAMLTRVEVFKQVGLFDPGYFMYYEDCDFCIRVKQSGYHMWYVPTAKVWHQVAASTGGEGSPWEMYYRTTSVFRFLRQHARGIQKPSLIALRIGYVWLQAILCEFSGRRESARLLRHGLQDGLAGISNRPLSDNRSHPL